MRVLLSTAVEWCQQKPRRGVFPPVNSSTAKEGQSPEGDPFLNL